MSSVQVTVLFAGQDIPKSPFEVDVDKAQGDPTKVTARGPGLEPVGNIANKPTYFDIYTAGLLCRVRFSSFAARVRNTHVNIVVSIHDVKGWSRLQVP